MKKLISLFVVLALCLSVAAAAFAEEIPSYYWEEKADEVADREGLFYTLNDHGLRFWAPAYLELNELNQEQVDDGYIARLSNSDNSSVLVITLNGSDQTHDGFYDYLVENEIEAREVYLNDLPAILYHYVREDSSEANCVAFITNNGKILEFVFNGDDDDFVADSQLIAYSIQPVQDEQEAEAQEKYSVTWEEAEAELTEAGYEGEFYKLAGVNIIAWFPNFLELQELTDEDVENGCIAYFTTEDGANFVTIHLQDLGMTYDEGLAMLADQGVENIREVDVNGLPMIVFTYTNKDGTDRNSSLLFTDDGYGLNIDCSAGDPEFETVSRYIIMSVQVEAE